MVLRSRLVLTLAGLSCAALAACGSSGGDAGESTPPATVTQTVTTGASPPTASGTTAAGTTSAPTSAPPAAKGCPAGGSGVPAGAASRVTIDVDGDAKPDTIWLVTADAPARLGITTASGASFETPLTFAGGSQPLGLVADVTGDGSQIIAFGFNSRVVDLLRIVDCGFAVVTNPEGQPYTFDLGFAGFGTGVGCVDVTGDGVRDLVGLNIVRDAGGQPASITRTVVALQGTAASNGQTYSLPVTPEAQASASTVSCGAATVESAGIPT